jgi:hypothetical protein
MATMATHLLKHGNSMATNLVVIILVLIVGLVRSSRDLPDTLLIGYVSDCGDEHNVAGQAVYDGVNVLIWSFWGISSSTQHAGAGFNMTCVENLRLELDEQGFDDVIFLASTGGWNGGHLPENMTGNKIYETWKAWGGHVFDGFDFDLEGNGNMTSPLNVFTMQCLDTMGEMSRLAKKGKMR